MEGYLGLSTALAAQGVRGAEAAELVEALRPALDMRALQPRHGFEIVFDGPRSARRVARLTYYLSRSSKLIVTRGEGGALTLRREPPPAALP